MTSHSEATSWYERIGCEARLYSKIFADTDVPQKEHDEVISIVATIKGDIVEVSLYERIGGEAAMDVAADAERVVSDLTISLRVSTQP